MNFFDKIEAMNHEALARGRRVQGLNQPLEGLFTSRPLRKEVLERLTSALEIKGFEPNLIDFLLLWEADPCHLLRVKGFGRRTVLRLHEKALEIISADEERLEILEIKKQIVAMAQAMGYHDAWSWSFDFPTLEHAKRRFQTWQKAWWFQPSKAPEVPLDPDKGEPGRAQGLYDTYETLCSSDDDDDAEKPEVLFLPPRAEKLGGGGDCQS